MAHTAIPPYFSWVVDRLLTVSAYPYHHTQLNYLTEHGIHTVVSISDELVPPFHTSPKLKVINLSIPPNGNPSINDIQNFVQLMENARQRREVVLVHSLRGTGRAAILVACYLIRLWECPADYVIDNLRLARPVSIENKEQERVIHQYHDQISNSFEGYYSRLSNDVERNWGVKTSFLGQPSVSTD